MGEEPQVQDQNQVYGTESKRIRYPVVVQLSVALGILLLVFGATYVNDVTALFKGKTNDTATAATPEVSTVIKPKVTTNTFEGTHVMARSAFVWDMKEQRALYNLDADAQLPLASLTKLMTALVAYELVDENKPVDVSVDAVREDGDSGLKEGETFSFRDLTDLTLIASSNDGAHALAAGAIDSAFGSKQGLDLFVKAMNIRAEQIGLSQTHFKNVTGLDLSDTEAGAVGSARDIAFLMEYILNHYPGLLAETTSKERTIANQSGETHDVENTDDLVGDVPGLRASKTGYTDLAGGNLVIAFDAGLNHPIIVAVLGSTFDGRFDDVKDLAARARQQVLSEDQ